MKLRRRILTYWPLLLMLLVAVVASLLFMGWDEGIGPFRSPHWRMVGVNMKGLPERQLIDRYGQPDYRQNTPSETFLIYYVGRGGEIGITIKNGVVADVGESAH